MKKELLSIETKEQKKARIAKAFKAVKDNFINERKGRTHPNVLKVMVRKRFGA